MNLEKTKSGKYRFRKMINGINICITFDKKPSKKEIAIAIDQKLSSMSHSESQNDDFITFGDAMLLHNKYKRNIVKLSTQEAHSVFYSMTSDELKSIPINNIESIHLQKEINLLAGRCKPKTVKNYRSYYTSVLSMFRPNDKFIVSIPKQVDPNLYMPTLDEVKAILNASKGTIFEVSLYLGLNGLRRGEIGALTLSDVDFDNHTILINKEKIKSKSAGAWLIMPYTKTSKSTRIVAVHESVTDLIRQNNAIYTGAPSSITPWIQRNCVRLGIPKFTLHTLRRFSTSLLFYDGFQSVDIQNRGGWDGDEVLNKHYRKSLDNNFDIQREMAKTLAEHFKF